MSRRLGDDPLARAKSAKSQASSPVSTDSGSGFQVVQSRSSYNDVFFQRRVGSVDDVTAPVFQEEAPEITEISQFPEIREVAAAQAVEPVFEAASEARPEPAPPVSFIEEMVTKLNVAAPGLPAPEARDEPASLSAPSEASEGSEDEPKPEVQQSGGFFKRLFGKLK